MERCRGIELHKVWDDITDRQKASIIQILVGFEAAFASSGFPMYGSLYYTNDLSKPRSIQHVLLKSDEAPDGLTFAVGPTTDRNFFDHGRSSVDADRSPGKALSMWSINRI